MTGPRQGVPWATTTQTVPRRLHSVQTLVDGIPGRRPCRKAVSDLEQLALVDRAAAQLEVDGDVRGDRRRGRERGDELRRGVDEARELLDVGEVPQRLDAARSRAGTDRDERLRDAAHLLDPLRVVRRRDRALDDGEVVRPFDLGARRLEEGGDLHLAGDRQQLVLAVEQRQLAAVAGGELPDGELRPAVHSARTRSHGAAVS